ncbi:MAG: DUF4105 domain-containing protein [Bacteroidaceae bacterium]|nr:DUF4105 domain-containing protein [Bacteroidaceae bacterium]MBQ4055982.1 DUF4105 domain-containing protein [Bacteroidaceae bacterium]
MRKFLFLFVVLLGFGLSTRAASTDSIRFSLMTCAPGTEIYALFGHTALRYENFTTKEDWVYNYGMFSFRTPNFVMRFVKGETDYQLGKIPYIYFREEYAQRGSSVYQQVLNLSEGEKIKLLRLLEENYLPKNRIYRYNYFYDNCTSRARDKVEESIEGKVVYPKNPEVRTFREIIHEYTAGSEWSEFGIDLCLGSEADEPIDERQQMFAPFYLLAFARDAQIHRGDSVVPFVRAEFKAVDATREEIGSGFPSPMTCAVLLLIVSGWMACWSIKKQRVLWAWDALLFGAQGLGGCIIAFLFFFSVHPTVGSNWMLMLLNPLPLVYLPVLIYKGVKGQKDYFHWVNVAYLTLFIMIMPVIPQKIHATILPLTLSLLICSAGHVYLYYKKKS